VGLKALIIAVAAVCMGGCGVTQPVRVLDEGRSAVIASLGGPVVPAAGIAFPVPYLNAGYAYGVSTGLTAAANLHLTALLFNDIGIDIGAAARLVRESGPVPEVTVKLQGMYFATVNPDPRSLFLAHASINASYLIGASALAYAGTEHAYQFREPEYFFTPFLGVQFPLSTVLDAQVETKWLAANHVTAHGVFEGAGSVNGRGNLGLYVGLLFHVGGR
jgi:hypothetical protein